MRLAVDADQCTGHGRCYSLAPQLLSPDDEGYVTIRGSSIEIPDDILKAWRGFGARGAQIRSVYGQTRSAGIRPVHRQAHRAGKHRAYHDGR